MAWKRAALLLACLLVGAAVGVVGFGWSGSQWWALAVPGAIVAGWLKVANPERCMPRDGQGEGGGGPVA